jgi:two-component system sensor histidine kinase YesM
MILQPLVENAIIHGIENLEFGGLIVVDTKKKYDTLYLRIFDNGVGISKEMQKTIMEGKIEKHTGHTTAIGLSNIIARVNLIQGGTFRICSSPRYGTMIQIVFPIMTGEL